GGGLQVRAQPGGAAGGAVQLGFEHDAVFAGGRRGVQRQAIEPLAVAELAANTFGELLRGAGDVDALSDAQRRSLRQRRCGGQWRKRHSYIVTLAFGRQRDAELDADGDLVSRASLFGGSLHESPRSSSQAV